MYKVIAIQLPRLPGDFFESRDLVSPISLLPLPGGDKQVTVLHSTESSKHRFTSTELNEWLEISQTCPVCRESDTSKFVSKTTTIDKEVFQKVLAYVLPSLPSQLPILDCSDNKNSRPEIAKDMSAGFRESGLLILYKRTADRANVKNVLYMSLTVRNDDSDDVHVYATCVSQKKIRELGIQCPPKSISRETLCDLLGVDIPVSEPCIDTEGEESLVNEFNKCLDSLLSSSSTYLHSVDEVLFIDRPNSVILDILRCSGITDKSQGIYSKLDHLRSIGDPNGLLNDLCLILITRIRSTPYVRCPEAFYAKLSSRGVDDLVHEDTKNEFSTFIRFLRDHTPDADLRAELNAVLSTRRR